MDVILFILFFMHSFKNQIGKNWYKIGTKAKTVL